MRMRAISPLVLAVLAAASVAAGAQTPVPTPTALVISNASYGGLPKLPACEVSANLVAAVLSRAGFKVTRQANPSNARMGTAIATLGDDMAAVADSRSLIYICGYVSAFSDRLFLVPVEARLERDADVLSQGIVARLLMSSVAGPTGKAGLVLMDVTQPPGQKGPPSFDSMLRSGDAAHGGLAVAQLPPADTQAPAPLATALADMVADGRLDVAAELNELKSRATLARSILFVRPPTEPSWLLGSPLPAPEPRPAAAPAPAAAAAAVSTLADPNPAERRRVQLGLQRLGYYRGRITGTFAPDTIAAIKQFQKDSEAEQSGKLTTRQMDQLLAP